MPKTDERGIPCHDERDNYCPVCGWDCEDKTAMTDPTISQDAREWAEKISPHIVALGGATAWNHVLDIFARFEAHLRTPAADTESLQQRVERLEGAINSVTLWMLHRFGPDSPEGKEAQTARAALGDDVG